MTRQKPKPKKKPAKKARKVKKQSPWLKRAKKRDPGDVALINDSD